jgi:hypothetical protein
MEWLDFLILIFATWRISLLFVVEAGPLHIFERFRRLFGVVDHQPSNQIGELFTCIWCFSIWVAFGLFALSELAFGVYRWIAIPLAISSGVILLQLLLQDEES